MEKKVTKYKLKNLKSIVCSTTTAIRFQCSYCNSNHVGKISLDNYVKQKHKELKMKMNDNLKGSDDSKDQNNEVKPKQNNEVKRKKTLPLKLQDPKENITSGSKRLAKSLKMEIDNKPEEKEIKIHDEIKPEQVFEKKKIKQKSKSDSYVSS